MANSAKAEAVFKKFEEIGIIPVVVLNDVKDAEPLGKCLVEGGLPAAEVTFRRRRGVDPHHGREVP